MSLPQKSELTYRRDIDGLRALAVISTIAFHCFPKIFSHGYLSVDVFFVISGFLITSIILKQSLKNRFSLLNFYSRRVKRILPPALLVLGVVTLAGIFTLFSNEFRSLQTYIGPSAAFYVNFRLMQDTFYFSFESTYKPLLHYWSLAVEEQFYLIWPVLLAAKVKFFTAKYKDPTQVARKLTLTTFVLLMPSLAYLLISQKDLYFSSFARAWELMMGGIAATLYYLLNNSAEARQRYLKYADAMSITGFAILGAGMFCERKLAIVLAVIGAFFIVITPENSRGKEILRLKVMNYIGLISFSLYLWHWPVLSFYHMYKVLITPGEIFALVFLIFLLSSLTYHWVEKPLKEQNWDIKSQEGFVNWRSLIPVTACLLISVFFFTAKFKKIPDLNLSKQTYVEDNQLPINNNCPLTQIQPEENLEQWCFSQNKSQPEQAVIVGDSQGHVLYRSMVMTSQRISWHFAGAESCSPFLESSMYPQCHKVVSDTYLNLEKHPEIKHVVMMMANHSFVEKQNVYSDPVVKEEIISHIRRLVTLNKKVYIGRPTPEFPHPISACSRQRFSFYKVFDIPEFCTIDRARWTELSKTFNSFIDSLKQAVPEIEILDGTDVVCDKENCYTTRGEWTLYRDMSHLSFEGNIQLSLKFLETIEKP